MVQSIRSAPYLSTIRWLLNVSQAQIEQMLMAEQVRQAQMMYLSALTETAFDRCIKKPDTALSSQERDCIRASVLKQVDTEKLVAGRYQRQQAAKKFS